jgi:hypothetical protein
MNARSVPVTLNAVRSWERQSLGIVIGQAISLSEGSSSRNQCMVKHDLALKKKRYDYRENHQTGWWYSRHRPLSWINQGENE